MEPILVERQAEMQKVAFEKGLQVDEINDLNLFNVQYYERGLNAIELIKDEEYYVGKIKIKREFVTKDHLKESFLFHTNVQDSSIEDNKFKATMLILHGFGENSDMFLESALTFALNGFDVHMIDLTG